MRFFYARCSTKEQNEGRQLAYAEQLGIEPRCIFIDKASGKNAERPALADMMSRLRPGDEVHITELSRLGRNTRDLLDLMDRFSSADVSLVSKKEEIDTTTAAGRLAFHVFASIAEFQRQIILESAAEGRAAAKAQGKKLGRKRVDEDALDLAMHLFEHDGGKSVKEICAKTGIGRSTIYREAESRGIRRASRGSKQ